MALGVLVYKESVDGHFRHVIVFNPEKPAYWIPVTVREMADIYLEYYTNLKDEFLLPRLKMEIAEYPEEELNAPAFSGHDTHFILKANGKNQDLQIMRFNPEYWDRSLPPSAIQFMCFYYKQSSAEELEEHFRNNGYPNYNEKLLQEIDWGKLAGMIQRK